MVLELICSVINRILYRLIPHPFAWIHTLPIMIPRKFKWVCADRAGIVVTGILDIDEIPRNFWKGSLDGNWIVNCEPMWDVQFRREWFVTITIHENLRIEKGNYTIPWDIKYSIILLPKKYITRITKMIAGKWVCIRNNKSINSTATKKYWVLTPAPGTTGPFS